MRGRQVAEVQHVNLTSDLYRHFWAVKQPQGLQRMPDAEVM
jgi:hypothetical protein